MKVSLSLLSLLAVAALGSAQTKATSITISRAPLDGGKSTVPGATSRSYSNVDCDLIGRASSDYGILRAYSYAKSNGQGRSDVDSGATPLYANSRASFSDTLTISAAGHAGETGYLDYSYELDGKQSVAGVSAYGDPSDAFGASSRITLSDYLSGSSGSNSIDTSGANSLSGVLGVHHARYAFTFGTAFDLRMEIIALAEVHALSTSEVAETDLEHTMLWGGFDAVTDGSGNAVAYSLSSGSGHDWTRASTEAVPEPSALAAVGLGALGLLRRRRK